MQITMLGTHRVSEDGFKTIQLEKGETYDLAHSTAIDVLNKGWAFNAEPSTGDNGLDAILDTLARLRAKRIIQNPATLIAMGAL